MDKQYQPFRYDHVIATVIALMVCLAVIVGPIQARAMADVQARIPLYTWRVVGIDFWTPPTYAAEDFRKGVVVTVRNTDPAAPYKLQSWAVIVPQGCLDYGTLRNVQLDQILKCTHTGTPTGLGMGNKYFRWVPL